MSDFQLGRHLAHEVLRPVLDRVEVERLKSTGNGMSAVGNGCMAMSGSNRGKTEASPGDTCR